MSGHSKWSTIKRQKGAADIKRGQTFTKIANAIALSAKAGGSGSPDDNPRLRVLMDEAKTVNMPKENIQRAIERGLGKLPGQTIEEVVYEGFGPGKIAFFIQGATDNKLRTFAEIKNLFERSGGSLGGQGSTAYMFENKGEVKAQSEKAQSEEEEILELIDMGAEDIESFEKDGVREYLVYTEATKLTEMSNKIVQAGYIVESKELIKKPNILIKIEDLELAKKVLEFTNKIEEHDDIQKVFANFDIDGRLISSF